jgi:adenine-specific DNA glycosylase
MGSISGQKTEADHPERTGYFLLMQHGDEVFLSQRPPVGLWGGLFCFPQFEMKMRCASGWPSARLRPII